MRPRGFAEAIGVALAGTALAIAFTYPVAFQPGSLGRINTDDGRWSIWVVSWVAHALTTEPLQLFHANIFYPHRYTLAFSEANIGAGVLGLPVWLLTENPYATHNVALLLSFVISFAGAYYLTQYLSGRRPAAAVAAVLFAYCPFVFARTAHVQLLFIGMLPWCLFAFHRLVDAPSVSRAVALGLLLWATALTCAYYAIFAALMIGLGTIVIATGRGLWRSVDHWAGIGLSGFMSVALTVPFFVPYRYVQDELGFERTVSDAAEYGVNLKAWAASSAWAHRWWLPAIEGFNEVLFPGVILLLLGATGVLHLVRQRGELAVLYGLIAILAFWASFGPQGGLYWLLYQTIPIFSFLRAPGRMGIMTVLALTVFASFAVSWLIARARQPWLIAGALFAIACAELAAMPLTQFREVAPVSPVYRRLAQLPYGPVVEFPYWYERSDFPRHAYYMLNSTAHWRPLVNGYSDHIPADFRAHVVRMSSFPTRESFRILGRIGARYVIFHTDMYNARLREQLVERLKTYSQYLRPIAQEGHVWLYEIVGWPN